MKINDNSNLINKKTYLNYVGNNSSTAMTIEKNKLLYMQGEKWDNNNYCISSDKRTIDTIYLNNVIPTESKNDLIFSSDYNKIQFNAPVNFTSTLSANTIDLNTLYFNTSYIPPSHQEGSLYWSDDDKTLCIDTEQNDVTLQIGQEIVVRVVNKTGVLIPNGSVVFINGAQGNRPTIALASSTSLSAASQTIGMATHDIDDNNNGYVTTFGLVRGLNTDSFVEGNTIWLSSTNGQFTSVEPIDSQYSIKIGVVTVKNATNGVILVKIDGQIKRTKAYIDNITTWHSTNNTTKQLSLSANWLDDENIQIGLDDETIKTGSEIIQKYKFVVPDYDTYTYTGINLRNDFSTITGSLVPFTNTFGMKIYNKSAGINYTNYYTAGGSLLPVDAGILVENVGFGAGGVFKNTASNTSFFLRPDLATSKGIYSQGTNTLSGSVVGYVGYGYNSNSTTGNSVGVLGYAAKTSSNSWAAGLLGLGTIAGGALINDKNWAIYGGHGHGGIFGGSMFIGTKTGTVSNYHQSYMVAQHTPTKFAYTDTGCLYVSNTAEIKSLLHCQNLITSPSISANSITATNTLFTSVSATNLTANTFLLSTSVWDDLKVNLSTANVAGANIPSFDVIIGACRSYAFGPTTMNEIFFEIQLPHTYKEGTTLYPHIHWAPKTNTAGNVRWGLEYSIAQVNDTISATTTNYATSASPAVTLKHVIASFPTIAGTTKSSIIHGRLFRDAANIADTYGSDAFGLSFDIHYEVDKLGSVNQT